MLRRAEWTAAVLLTLALAGLHLLRVNHAGGLWRDEAAAAALATLPTWGEVAGSFQHEAFPLLFPAAVRGWVGIFGGGDLALRLFGALVGLALLGALWCNARSWFPGRAGSGLPLLSLIVVGTNPAVLVFGDSLRGYGLGTVLILLTCGAFGRLVVRPDRRSVVLAALLAVASVQTLLHNAALLLALGLGAALAAARRKRWRSVAAVLGCGALAALSLLPYAGPLAAARSWNVLVTFPVAPADLLQALARTLAGPLPAFLWLWLSLLALGLAAGIWSLLRKTSAEATSGQDGNAAADLTLYLILSLPLAVLTQLGFLWQLGYAPRPWYFLPLLALAGSALDLLLAPNRTSPATSRTRP
ncbi:MAG TPA: glycosyltransferase family 39 protein, partial [Thermoanaerobaculia bacterium]|nr:glycosyltransferase family 39 protein [Thermoanaerobaculia bacterium]